MKVFIYSAVWLATITKARTLFSTLNRKIVYISELLKEALLIFQIIIKMDNKEISFIPVEKSELEKFTNDMVDSFAVSVHENHMPDSLIPPRSSIQESFDDPHSELYHICLNDEKIGGVILVIDNETNHNHLDLLFLYSGRDNRGLGYSIWKSIEAKYPNTKIWETATPYFEKRNINFYINKCGFHAVEFLNKYHKDPNHPNDEDEFFIFQKVMK